MSDKHFPEVKLPKGSITIYGLWHGLREPRPTREMTERLGRAVNRFGPNDYFVVEGAPYDYFLDGVLVSGPNLIIQYLLDVPQIKRKITFLDNRAEKTEFYHHGILWDKTDLKIGEWLETQKEQLEEPDQSEYENILFTPEYIGIIKQAYTGMIKEGVDGVTDDEVVGYVEKRFTLRSLLMGRNSFHRAQALGSYPLHGTVHFFLGNLHGGESRRFLKNPRAVQTYLGKIPPELRDIYDQNEDIQNEITEAFHRLALQLSPTERPLFLRSIVDFAHRRYVESLGGEVVFIKVE